MNETQGAAGRFTFGGRLALDFTWTLRYRAVAPTELLGDPGDLVGWLVETQLLDRPVPCTDADYTDAVELREAIYEAASASIDGKALPARAVRTINRLAAEAAPAPQLTPSGEDVVYRVSAPPVRSALGDIARDAIDVIAHTPAGRLRRCDGPMCSLLFVDASRPGQRRWCSALTCGNRVNTRSYRERRN